MLRTLVMLGLLAWPALAPVPALAQEVDYVPHFRVFTGAGEPATLADIVRAMASVDVIYVGEAHTDPVGHWIEAELVRGALASISTTGAGSRPFALSLEMFERDVQGIVDEYLQGLITEEQFRSNGRAWEYYATDYRPLVESAKAAGVPVIAANAPRRYVNRVSRLGKEALGDLPASARSFLPPLPYTGPSEAYRRDWLALMADMPMQPRCVPPAGQPAAPRPATPDSLARPAQRPATDSPAQPPHAPPKAPAAMPSHSAAFMENGLQSQSLWDTSMAHSITTFLASHPGALVLHVVGAFHVAHARGIPEQVQGYRAETRGLVVSMAPADDFRTFNRDEHSGLGDFVILTDQSLDLDYQRNCVDKRPGN